MLRFTLMLALTLILVLGLTLTLVLTLTLRALLMLAHTPSVDPLLASNTRRRRRTLQYYADCRPALLLALSRPVFPVWWQCIRPRPVAA